MKIFAVRIGERYGEEYEHYIEKKLKDYEVHWIRTPFDSRVQLQWNKMLAMSLPDTDPVCVIDIDILLLNNYKEIFDYPLQPGEFLAAPGWWREPNPRFTINGGFYKYRPAECSYIFEKFISDPLHWQHKYIAEGYTSGPVNGEQHFVEDSVREQLTLKTLPNSWICRMEGRNKWFARHTLGKLNTRYKEVSGNPYMFLGEEFHPDIKFVHFTHMDNHPHTWLHYNRFID